MVMVGIEKVNHLNRHSNNKKYSSGFKYSDYLISKVQAITNIGSLIVNIKQRLIKSKFAGTRRHDGENNFIQNYYQYSTK
jgi:hypothetical protein